MERQEPQNLYLCSMCFFRCNLYDKLIRHYIRYHKHDPQFKIQCNYHGCGATHRKWKSFKQHLKRQHNIEEIFDNFNEDDQDLLEEESQNNILINEENPVQYNDYGKV